MALAAGQASASSSGTASSTSFFSRLWSNFWGRSGPVPAGESVLLSRPDKVKGATVQDARPVSDEGQVPHAQAEPLPEAQVTALGDETGQFFVAATGRPSDGTVCLSDFDRISVLGKGSFGKVVLVQKKGTDNRYAMKVLKKSKLRRAKQVERTKTERRVLEVCENHPFVMNMSYAFQTEEKLYIVLEYCSGGELFFHLSRYRKFPEHVGRFYAAELVCALDFLHEHGIIYRDMKPENVLLDSQGHVKLGDFGLAKDNIWDAVSGAKSICGTPEYMAPEVLNKIGHGQSVDWWGLGMILYEMLTGLPPWYTKDRQKLFQRLRYAPLRIPPTMSMECATCISAFLCRNPAERLGSRGVAAIKAHPFFVIPHPKREGAPQELVVEPGPTDGLPSEPEHPFDWDLLEARALRPPIDPMEGIEVSADDRANTANFDPQFTKLEVETDNEDDEAMTYEHFEGFSFMGSGSLEIGSGDDIQTETSGAVDQEGNGIWSRKRDSCPSLGFDGDVLIEPRSTTVEELGEEIRKLSSASSQNRDTPIKDMPDLDTLNIQFALEDP